MNTSERIAVLGALSRRWLDRQFPYRRRAVRRLVQKSRFAPQAAEAMLDALFRELTESRLRLLVRAEAGSAARLDAAGTPRQITHVLSGNVPHPGVVSVALGLLVRARNLIKTSSQDEGIVEEYLASLKKAAPRLAAQCRRIASSDRRPLAAAVEASDLVIVYGSDEAVEAVRAMAGRRKKVVAYGHRVSFSLLTRAALTPSVARRTALDVWMADRRGCLSPAAIWVEQSKKADGFCREVLQQLERLERAEGRVGGDPARAVAIRTAQQEARLAGGLFWPTARRRYFVRVYPVKPEWTDAPGADIRLYSSLGDVYRVLGRFSRALQACALECAPSQRAAITRRLARLGFTRVCRAGALQFPPLTWPHDGRPRFADWLVAPRPEGGKIRR